MKKMGLIDKIKQKGRNLALAGIAGLSCLASGCVGGFQHIVTYDSVPRGAHIFSNGKYYGETPTRIRYTVPNYQEEIFCGPIDCAKEGYIPQRTELRLKVAPNQYTRTILDGAHIADFHHTFFLQPDPNYKPAPKPAEPELDISIIPTLIFPLPIRR